MTLFIIMKEII